MTSTKSCQLKKYYVHKSVVLISKDNWQIVCQLINNVLTVCKSKIMIRKNSASNMLKLIIHAPIQEKSFNCVQSIRCTH